jgi:signal transduction histidine kinase
VVPSPPLALTLGGTAFFCLAVALFALYRRSGRAYLFDWAMGWLAATVALGAGLEADVQVTPGTPKGVLAASVLLAVVAVLGQTMFQLQGMRRLTAGRAMDARTGTRVGVALLAYAVLATVVTTVWQGKLSAFLLAISLPHVVLGVAFLASAWDLHRAGRMHGFGAWLLPLAFTGYGLHSLRVAFTPAARLPVPHLLIIGFLAMVAAFAIVYGAVAWTLDEEQERLREASERHKQLETQLLEAQKLEALGQLAAGIAHDFNNLLTVTGAHAQLIEMEPGDEERTVESVREILVAKDRASRLVTHLLTFARKQILQLETMDANDVIVGLGGFLRPLIGDHVVLEVRPSNEEARIEADRGHLEQVLVNLVLNARDAMPGGGRVVLEALTHTSDRPTVLAGVEIPEGQWVVFRVADTGVGMTEEVRARAFEPFFTTKTRGYGTGLGLATAYGIVEQSQGRIVVESEPGRGSTFRIFLPAVPDGATSERASDVG